MKFSKVSRNALFIILEGIMAGIILNLFSPFVQMFAKRMGAQDVHIALLNSIPPLIAIFVLIPCSILLDRINDKKFVTGLMILLNSLFYVAIAFVPFIPDGIKVIVYVLLIGLMNWPGSLYITAWQSFFAGTFIGSEANLVFSKRSKYNAFFGLLTVLLTGYILSSIPKSEGQRIILYQLFYVSCFLFSIIQVLFLAQVRPGSKSRENHESEDKPRFNLKEFKEMFSNREFVIFCLCTFGFHISWQIGWPLFFIYNVDYIKIGEFQMSIINVGSGLASFLSYSLWNRIVDKKGNSFVIIICALGLAANPFFFSVLMPFYLVVLVQALAGAFSAGFSLTLFCGLLETLPENKKTVYISTFNTFINVSGFFSPLLGVWMYERTGIYRSMFIIGVMRVAGGLLFLWRWIWMKKQKKIEQDMELPAGLA